MLFLPLIALVVLCFALICYVIQYKTKMRSHCLSQVIEIQKNLVRSEESLFALNPVAKALRLRLQLAYSALAAAAGNPAAMASIELEINQIILQKKELDIIQKLIIKTAKLNLDFRTNQLAFELAQTSKGMSSIWNFYIESFTNVRQSQKPQVAVVPDSPELAPVYELAADYKLRQTVAYHWQMCFRTKKNAQEVLKSENIFEMSCESSAESKRGTWDILINADKS